MSDAGEPIETRSFVERNYRWNFSVNVVDLAFYSLGLNMVSQTTILPLLVSQLTPSTFAVGLISTIFSLGFLLPQLFTAAHTEGLRRKKPFLMLYSGITERMPYLVMGIVVWLFARSSPQVTLVVFFLLLLMAAGTAGLLTPAWMDLIAKVIPMQHRGFYFGFGNGLGALMGIAGAALAGWFLTAWPYPQNFALCFVVAAVCFGISWVGLALNREPDSEVINKHESLTAYFKLLPAIIRSDRNYQVFLVSRSMANLGGMATGFFIVYGAQQFTLSGEAVGVLTAVLVGSQALLNVLWGLLGDHKGHKIVLVCSSLIMSAAALAAVVIHSAAAFWIVFLLVGVSMAGDSVSGFNIIFEFCPPGERPTYIGLTNTLLAPFKALAPLLGGALANWLGFPAMFGFAAVTALLGGLLLAFWLREPRLQMRT
jgi:MFS family permease